MSFTKYVLDVLSKQTTGLVARKYVSDLYQVAAYVSRDDVVVGC
jgi:hypothetical protein